MRLISIATVIATLSVASIVHAQTAPPVPAAAQPGSEAKAGNGPRGNNPEARARWEKFRAVCGTDISTHCANAQLADGRGEMRQCIETHKAKFTTDCQAAIADRTAAREARKQAEPTGGAKPKS